MRKTNGDETAYPLPETPGIHNLPSCNGLTKREYFAAAIMAAVTGCQHWINEAIECCPEDPAEHLAEVALNHADNLIAALNEKKP